MLAVLYYLYPPLELGRGIFAIGFILVAATLFLWRRFFSAINSQPQYAERTLIFGDCPLATSLLRELESRPELGLRVVDHVLAAGNRTTEPNCVPTESSDIPHEAVACDELSRAVKVHRVNRIVVAMATAVESYPSIFCSRSRVAACSFKMGLMSMKPSLAKSLSNHFAWGGFFFRRGFTSPDFY